MDNKNDPALTEKIPRDELLALLTSLMARDGIRSPDASDSNDDSRAGAQEDAWTVGPVRLADDW